MPKQPKQKQYWLHVTESGEEVTYAAPPTDVKTLTIWVADERWEITKTYDAVVYNNEKAKEAALSVKPRGQGWELHDTSEVFSTTWRRRRRN
jgi:hypothetical protein